MRKTLIASLAVLAIAALLAGTGCTRVRLQDRPETRSFTRTDAVPLAGAKELQTELRVAVGELTVSAESSPTTNAVTADFIYSPESWQPEVEYGVADGVGKLIVRQPDDLSSTPFGHADNTWDVRLAGGVPTTLRLRLGVGKSDVDLSRIDVTDLDAVTGVGDTTIDLTGSRPHDVDARVEAGVGRLVVRLPKNVGVKVNGRQDGVGNFSADGFTADGNSWVNGAYSGSGPKIRIDLIRGVGDVTLLLAD
jgi:hypothetical protein